MNLKTIACLAFAVFTIIGLSSCETEEIPTTYNVYNIDNQSSYELIFNRSSQKITIDTTTSREIFSTEQVVQAPITPDEGLIGYVDDEEKIYLYRESAGVEIKALNIYLNTDLTWTEEYHEAVDGDHIYHHTLIVTDDMLE